LKQFFDSILERTAQTAPKMEMAVAIPKNEPPKKIVERGVLKDRPYRLFGDGTIEIETMLGLRRFASIQEAYEFIGR